MDDPQFEDSIEEEDDGETLKHVLRVLVVEDTVELGEIIAATLERMEMIAFTETHGSRALKTYEKLRPDIVLLDIGLPDMTGWKVLDAIKETTAQSRRPIIIIISAYGDPANRLMGKLQGVDSYLIKPFTPSEVERIIQTPLTGEIEMHECVSCGWSRVF